MNQQMMMRMKKLQKELEQAQDKVSSTIFTGSSAGLVSIKMNGDKELIGISINHEMIESKEDVEMLEDAIVAAFNDCSKQIDAEKERVLGPFTSMLPGGLF